MADIAGVFFDVGVRADVGHRAAVAPDEAGMDDADETGLAGGDMRAGSCVSQGRTHCIVDATVMRLGHGDNGLDHETPTRRRTSAAIDTFERDHMNHRLNAAHM